MVDLEEGGDGDARAELVQLVRTISRYLPDSRLSVRQRVEVRRDLSFLLAESHRHPFRPRVAVELCASVLVDVSHALAEPTRATMLLACADHLGWVAAAEAGSPVHPEDASGLLGRAMVTSSAEGDAVGAPPPHDDDGRLFPPRPRSPRPRPGARP